MDNLGFALGLRGPLYSTNTVNAFAVRSSNCIELMPLGKSKVSNATQENYYVGNRLEDIALRTTVRTALVGGITLGLLSALFAISCTLTGFIKPLTIAAGIILGIGFICMALHYAKTNTLNTSHFHSINNDEINKRDDYKLLIEDDDVIDVF